MTQTIIAILGILGNIVASFILSRKEMRNAFNLVSQCVVWGRGGSLVDRAADSGPCDPSLIPLGDKRKKTKKRPRLAHLINVNELFKTGLFKALVNFNGKYHLITKQNHKNLRAVLAVMSMLTLRGIQVLIICVLFFLLLAQSACIHLRIYVLLQTPTDGMGRTFSVTHMPQPGIELMWAQLHFFEEP